VAASHPPRLASERWLSRPETQAVFAALAARGFAARAVGGAVRNALIGEPVSEVDIATPARPEQVVQAAAAAGLQAVPTGVAHGTVTVLSGHHPFEVTTLRKDVATHGRHATVEFGDDWAADARRRDFTINALYCSADGEVFDPLGGYADVAARRVRFIGEPAERIREDYLRILRFFRITAAYGAGAPDGAGLAACVRERAGLAILSAERVRQEMLRLLAAPRGPELTATMQDYGLLPAVLGAAPRPALLARLAAVEAALGLEPDALLRLAALAVEVPEDAERLGARWRLSNEETARLLSVTGRAPDVAPAVPEREARAHLYALGQAAYRNRLLIAWARSGDPPANAAWRGRLHLPERWQPPRFPIGGADVLARGLAAGPRVGEILRALEAWWIAGDFAADAPALRAKLDELAASAERGGAQP
jgi:poly(A) polymerase